jgi:hypothetical protein
MVQEQTCIRFVWILVEMLDTAGVEGARAPQQTVDCITLPQEQFG